MKITVYFLASTLLLLLAGCGAQGRDPAPVLGEVDNVIARTPEYDATREQAIATLKHRRDAAPAASLERYELGEQLFGLYESYQCDSALATLAANAAVAEALGRRDLTAVVELQRAALLSKAGLYTEAFNSLGRLAAAELDSAARAAYYLCYSDLYQYLIEYEGDRTFSADYHRLKQAYSDSCALYARPTGSELVALTASNLIDGGNIDGGLQLLEENLPLYQSGSREYSVIASIYAYGCLQKGDTDGAMQYYALAAMSDMQGCIKENMALRALGEIMYDRGDISRANRYLKKSMDDANFFSARMRGNQSANLLPLVSDSFQQLQESQQRLLRWFLIVTVALLVALMVAAFFALRQLRAVRRLNYELQTTNYELEAKSEQLRTTNSELEEANKIKEEYLGRFLQLCSGYISTLEQYRKMLYQRATAGSLQDLYRQLKSQKIINDTLTGFYAAFDDAFLNIYPDFVERFNSLLTPEGRSTPRAGERLNTEMRIFALIRLGITDSARIADFLRCSITTVYTYRSKIKSRTLPSVPDFESALSTP